MAQMGKGRQVRKRGLTSTSTSTSRSTSTSTVVVGLLLMFSLMALMALMMMIMSNTNTKSSNDDGDDVLDLTSILRTTLHRAHVTNDTTTPTSTSTSTSTSDLDQWVEVLSWEPRAVVFHHFLSKHECDYLIDLAKPHMAKSTVVDEKTGKSRDSRVRTSSGTFLPRGRDKIIQNIEKRIADFTFLPIEHGEGLQVLHYEVGQKYEPHFDYFLDEFNTVNGGQRIATLLMYLSDVEYGGETVFPDAKGNKSAVPYWNELSECGKEGLSVKPKLGDALLFWSMKPDASLDPSSLHGGCPVIKGNKWSATKWIRVNEYQA